jgi:hypothetical protein
MNGSASTTIDTSTSVNVSTAGTLSTCNARATTNASATRPNAIPTESSDTGRCRTRSPSVAVVIRYCAGWTAREERVAGWAARASPASLQSAARDSSPYRHAKLTGTHRTKRTMPLGGTRGEAEANFEVKRCCATDQTEPCRTGTRRGQPPLPPAVTRRSTPARACRTASDASPRTRRSPPRAAAFAQRRRDHGGASRARTGRARTGSATRPDARSRTPPGRP